MRIRELNDDYYYFYFTGAFSSRGRKLSPAVEDESSCQPMLAGDTGAVRRIACIHTYRRCEPAADITRSRDVR
jgi:hypothetical protein